MINLLVVSARDMKPVAFLVTNSNSFDFLLIYTRIDSRCYCGNFSLQEFFLENISEETDISLRSPGKVYINKTNVESTEIEEPALPATNISDEGKLKQIKDDLLCNCGQNAIICWMQIK